MTTDPPARPRSNRANVLVIVLGLAVVVASEVYIVSAFSVNNLRQTGRSTGRLHAICVGESAFGKIHACLRGMSWRGRWFRSAPSEETDVPLGGGRASWYVGDTPDAERRVDVWVQAVFGDSRVTMFWRVHHREDRLDLRGGAVPELFTFLPDDADKPTAAADDPTLAEVRRQIAQAAARRIAAAKLAQAASQPRSFAGMATIWG